MSNTIYKPDLLYPELSYKIIGCAYEVFNNVGGGHKEKVYQKAMKIEFENVGLSFIEQLYYPVKFKNFTLEKSFFDFSVDEKIVVELKSLGYFTKGNFEQVLHYLNSSNLKLALLITFGQNEVRFKRVVNFKTK